MSDAQSMPAPPDVSPPARIDVKRAFHVYVHGRSRNIDPHGKTTAVARLAALAGAPDESAAEGPARAAVHVSVPERSDLRYDRNAGTWRDRGAADRGGGEA